MSILCLRCQVSGRVQGVGFRYATAEHAQMLALAGSATGSGQRR